MPAIKKKKPKRTSGWKKTTSGWKHSALRAAKPRLKRKSRPKTPEPINVVIETPYIEALVGKDKPNYPAVFDENFKYLRLPDKALDYSGAIPQGSIVRATNKWPLGRKCLITYKYDVTSIMENREALKVFDCVAVGAFRDKIAQEAYTMFGTNYVDAMTSRLRDEYSNFNVRLEHARISETTNRIALARAIKEASALKELESRYQSMFAGGQKKAKKKFEKEYKKLLDNPKIQGIIFNDGILEVYTRMIYCVDPRSEIEHEIGEFKIRVNMDACDIHIFNMTRRINTPYMVDAHAPHVHPSGVPCFGNIGTTVSELVAKYEIVMLTELLFGFLESVNVYDSHGGAQIHCWPESKRARKGKDDAKTIASGC